MKAAIEVNVPEPAIGVRRAPRGFNWSAFFRSPYTILQMVSFVLLYSMVVSAFDEVGPRLMWLMFLLPPWLACVYGTHLLKEWKAQYQEKQG